MNFATECWFLTGPTAGGKTEVGVELARRLGAEVVSMDSMALYRGMDIGTAKPSAQQRAAVPHHLIDLVEPHEDFSVAQYLEAAERAVREIQGRGRKALFVGGTPLYLKALLRGIFEGPPADWDLRRELEAEEKSLGPGHLHRRLAAIDPAAAARLHANDTRRLVRALEVYLKTGRPISHWQQQFDVGLPAEACHVFVLDWPREALYERINRRVEQMFSQGLVDEVRGLLAARRPLRSDDARHPERVENAELVSSPVLSHTARQAVGYREVIEHLEGRRTLPETVELVQRHTRQFAKRQGTWFRSLSECRFVAICGEVDAGEMTQRILSLAGSLAPSL